MNGIAPCLTLLALFCMGCRSTPTPVTKTSPPKVTDFERIDRLMDEVDQQIKANPSSADHLLNAQDLLDQILAQHPEHYYARRLKATLWHQLSNPQKTQAAYRDYLHAFPGDDRSRLELASIYLRQNQPAQAIPLLEEVMKTWPQTWMPPRLMAQAQKSLGKPLQAASFLEASDLLKSERQPAKPKITVHAKYLSPSRQKPKTHPMPVQPSESLRK